MTGKVCAKCGRKYLSFDDNDGSICEACTAKAAMADSGTESEKEGQQNAQSHNVETHFIKFEDAYASEMREDRKRERKMKRAQIFFVIIVIVIIALIVMLERSLTGTVE